MCIENGGLHGLTRWSGALFLHWGLCTKNFSSQLMYWASQSQNSKLLVQLRQYDILKLLRTLQGHLCIANNLTCVISTYTKSLQQAFTLNFVKYQAIYCNYEDKMGEKATYMQHRIQLLACPFTRTLVLPSNCLSLNSGGARGSPGLL